MELKKPLILVLNKIDLVPASVVAAWTTYFKRFVFFTLFWFIGVSQMRNVFSLFPHLHIVWFTSFPKDNRRLDAAKSE